MPAHPCWSIHRNGVPRRHLTLLSRMWTIDVVLMGVFHRPDLGAMVGRLDKSVRVDKLR